MDPDKVERGEAALSGAAGGLAVVGDEHPDSGTNDKERPRSAGDGGRESGRFRLGKTAYVVEETSTKSDGVFLEEEDNEEDDEEEGTRVTGLGGRLGWSFAVAAGVEIGVTATGLGGG